jgi:ABC-type phosphate transport system substrate-binding protein
MSAIWEGRKSYCEQVWQFSSHFSLVVFLTNRNNASNLYNGSILSDIFQVIEKQKQENDFRKKNLGEINLIEFSS